MKLTKQGVRDLNDPKPPKREAKPRLVEMCLHVDIKTLWWTSGERECKTCGKRWPTNYEGPLR